ncbi:hypothetical protein GCM10007103_01600 [Salinimicrobium marinum]|uniref:TonB-dependent receptor plug domain-containing protein n=1 Tax=Salinimicrobium marinum TaxID=680283 RepID=A0A918VUG4_9FLAO|nr:hypothetical protein [Salinimicrobium marinum]GHA24067.1 hypothetical protein GCM10007103_01600 [Salinimicrobium marinum]
MKATTFLCTILTSMLFLTKVGAQESLIITKEQNSEWVNSLKSAELPESLDLLQQRMQADTDIFYIGARNPHGKERVEQGYQEQSYCRPLYIFISEGKEPVFIKSNPDEATVKKLRDYLKPENIAEVEVETGIPAEAIYGSRGSCGVVKMQIRNKENFNQLQDLLK